MKKEMKKDGGFTSSFNKLKEVWAALIFFAGLFSFLSFKTYDVNDISTISSAQVPEALHNFFGLTGACFSYFSFIYFGLAAYLLPGFLIAWSARAFVVGFKLGWLNFYIKLFLFASLLVTLTVFFHTTLVYPYSYIDLETLQKIMPHPYFGGLTGKFIAEKFTTVYLGAKGTVVISGFLIVILFLLITDGRPLYAARWMALRLYKVLIVLYNTAVTVVTFINSELTRIRENKPRVSKPKKRKKDVVPKFKPEPEPESEPESPDKKFSFKPKIKQKTKIIESQPVEEVDFSSRPLKSVEHSYEFPPVDFLELPKKHKESDVKNSLQRKAELLRKTLLEFGVEVNVSEITRGPVITRYELTLAPGVKVQRITALSDDIALAMKTPHIRIVAPIPGKSAVGIEVPNDIKAIVALRDLLCSKEFINTKANLPLILGKDIAGRALISDLTSAPHLLIAGATGSGKSVCINAIIMSLLYSCSPNVLKFLMVDPKKVELAQYNDIPHMLAPVITDPKKVSMGLNWVVREMENRYQILADAGVRNIKGFNSLPTEDRLRVTVTKNFVQGIMPYIVVILDELADLMMVAQDDIEDAIARLAQLSRAVGIHLILATQRPSVNVITGVIKANFPVRISFKVSSKVDSRTVLDANGAEKLLGNGDMLFLPPGTSKLIRGQGTYISDGEIRKVVEYVKAQVEEEDIQEEDIFANPELALEHEEQMDDELYGQAVETVLTLQQASSSVLQRKLRVGYARAARLIDMMEANGVVGPHRGSKPREILIEE